MKAAWLLLALPLASAALATSRDQEQLKLTRWWPCYGCYTSILQVPVDREKVPERFTWSPLDLGIIQEAFTMPPLDLSRLQRDVPLSPLEEGSIQVEDQTKPRPPKRRRPCHGCYTPMSEGKFTLSPLAASRIEVEDQTKPPPPPPRRRPCHGCYTHMSVSATLLMPQKEIRFLEESTVPRLDQSSIQAQGSEARTRREAKGSTLARRRGKQRAVAKPVCRGCYSGLMIVAPPGKEASVSLESEGDRSREGN